MPQPVHLLEVGDILHSTSGYECTQNEFAQIVSRTTKTVKIQYLTNVQVGVQNPDPPFNGHELPGKPTEKFAMARIRVRGEYECLKNWSRWNGKRCYFSHWW